MWRRLPLPGAASVHRTPQRLMSRRGGRAVDAASMIFLARAIDFSSEQSLCFRGHFARPKGDQLGCPESDPITRPLTAHSAGGY